LNTINNQNISNEPLVTSAIANRNTAGAAEPTFKSVLSNQINGKQSTNSAKSLEADPSTHAKIKGKNTDSQSENNDDGMTSDKAQVAVTCPIITDLSAQLTLNTNTPINNAAIRLDDFPNQLTTGKEILPQLAIGSTAISTNPQQKTSNLAAPLSFSLDKKTVDTNQSPVTTLPDSLSSTINFPKINELSTTKHSINTEISSTNQTNNLPTTETITSQLATVQPPVTLPIMETIQPSKAEGAYLNTANWQHEVSQKVIWMNNGGHHSATLTLNSPDLGPLQVVIKVNHAQQAEANFISDNHELRQILADSMLQLRDAMKQSGIELGTTNIQTGSNNQHTFNPPSQNTSYSQTKNKAVSNRLIQQVTGATAEIRTQQGMVNTFA